MVIKSKNDILEKKAEEIIAKNESDKKRKESEEPLVKQTTVYLNQAEYRDFRKNLPKGVSPSQIFGAVMCLYNSNDPKFKKMIADEIMKKLL